MKNPFYLPNRRFVFFSIGMCMVAAGVFLATRFFPLDLWPTFIAAGISCVVIARLLLLISAPNEVRDGSGYIPQTDVDLNQGDRVVSAKVEKFQPLGISASASIIQPAQDAHKKGLLAGDADEEDRAA